MDEKEKSMKVFNLLEQINKDASQIVSNLGTEEDVKKRYNTLL